MAAILSVQNLSRSFRGLHATRDVSFDLPAGSQEAIIGPNGAGKSTLFNLLSGFHRPDAGRILFRGEDIARLPPHEIVRRGISRAFQVANIFGRMTVLENVRCAVQARMGLSLNVFAQAHRLGLDETRRVLRLCRLEDKQDALASSLSQGDTKKLELALALAGQPAVLLLDEPTAGMSLEETRETMEVVADMNRDLGITILFTEHDMAVVFGYARRITVLHRGEIIAQGSPEAVRANPLVQEVYFGEAA